MHFSVDAHAIGCHLTGNEVYIRNLLTQFAQLDRSSRFTAFLSMPQADSLVPQRFRRHWVGKNPFVRLGFDLPQFLTRERPDLLHVQYTGPLYGSTPLIVSVHDVSFLEHPEYFTWFRAHQLKITVERTVHQAARILTPSEFSRRAVQQAYGIDPRKIIAIPNAVSSSFRPVQRETAEARIREKFGIPGPFVLTVGDLQPRKNHLGLIRAFEQALRAHPHLPHHLVFVGKQTWYSPVVRRAVEHSSIARRIHIPGFVEDDDLINFYGACDLFVFPSFYEGFGLPILEAMACGRAVACSNTSAMPEVAHAAAILFDPNSDEEMARAIEDVLLDPELRLRMERLAAHRSAAFSWERSARETLDVYYDVAGATRPVLPKEQPIPAGRE